MADVTGEALLSVFATVGSKLSDLNVADGQLIFVQDKCQIALDYNGRRTIYHQIETLATDAERAAMLAPVSGIFYYVVDKPAIWTYNAGWKCITISPDDFSEISDEEIDALFKT